MALRRTGLCRATAGAIAATLMIAAAVRSQNPATPPGDGSTTLYLVLRTGPQEDENAILETLKTGLRKSGAAITGQPTIKAVSPAFFQEFATLVDRASESDVSEAKEGLSIHMLPARGTIYELKLKPTQILKQLRVKYQKGSTKSYTPAAPSEAGGPLVLTVPGLYAFTPEEGDTPTSYEADVLEIGKPDATQKGTWPVGDKFFVVTMRNFVGDRKSMFAIIADGTQVANPLENVQLGNDLLFAFASLRSSVGVLPPPINPKGELTISVPTIPKRNPKRVWVYFPLDEKGMTEARTAFRKFNQFELPAEIRKKNVPADKQVTLSAKDGPQWYELPLAANETPPRFSRRVQLDLGELVQFSERYPKVWMLQVWEFDTGKPEAIFVEHPTEGRVLVREEELSGWQKGLHGAIKQNSPTPKTSK